MTIDVRATQPDEARAVADTVAAALLFPRLTDVEWPGRESSWTECDSFSAWDGDRCVGHAAAYRLDTTVPGGARLATAGVTRIGVLPTHTRRGLLTAMMHQLLTEARSDGKVLANLRASEAVIYPRYGFAIAAEAVGVKVTTRSAGAIRAPADGKFRILANTEVLDVVPAVYEDCARWRVGTVTRPDFIWRRTLDDAVTAAKPSFVAVHEDPAGTLDGFVHYDVRWAEDAGGSETGAGEIHNLFGADASVERALWSYILGIDLILEWKADTRPIDEAIRFAMADTRAYKVYERWDEQWLRILDVDAALAGRTYRSVDRQVTVHVTDPLFPANDGSWRVSTGGAARTEDEPDLVVDIGTLSAAYLGGTSWCELVDAGRVEVRRADAVADADSLFAQRPAPFCGTFF